MKNENLREKIVWNSEIFLGLKNWNRRFTVSLLIVIELPQVFFLSKGMCFKIYKSTISTEFAPLTSSCQPDKTPYLAVKRIEVSIPEIYLCFVVPSRHFDSAKKKTSIGLGKRDHNQNGILNCVNKKKDIYFFYKKIIHQIFYYS